MRTLSRFLAVAAAAALLGACSQAAPQPGAGEPTAAAVEPGATAAPGAAYPGPGAYPAPGAAYPGPTPAPFPTLSMDPIVVPQPASAQVGVVTGTLLRLGDDGTRTPLAGTQLYLGAIISSTSGVEGMVQMDRTSSPGAITNGLGQFVFTDVPVGRYGLMYDGVEGTLLLNDPSSGGDFVIDVQGGDVDQLGELAYPLPAAQ